MTGPKSNRVAKVWAQCVDLWRAENVPEIEIIPYDYSKHSFTPWLHRNGIHGASSNPLQSTAFHLGLYLTDKPRDLGIAYKLHAFCVNYRLHPDYMVLRYAFSANGSETSGWWGQNAKNVLPLVDEPGVSFRDFESSQFRDLSQVVPVAAREWRLISEQWFIVRVPDLMIDGSKERKRWERHCRDMVERREKAEYERLKSKFGGP